MKRSVEAKAVNPNNGEEHTIAFDTWFPRGNGLTLHACAEFERQKKFTPDIDKITIS